MLAENIEFLLLNTWMVWVLFFFMISSLTLYTFCVSSYQAFPAQEEVLAWHGYPRFYVYWLSDYLWAYWSYRRKKMTNYSDTYFNMSDYGQLYQCFMSWLIFSPVMYIKLIHPYINYFSKKGCDKFGTLVDTTHLTPDLTGYTTDGNTYIDGQLHNG